MTAPVTGAAAAVAAYQAAPALGLLPGGLTGAVLTLMARQAAMRSRVTAATLRMVLRDYASVVDPRDPRAIEAFARSTLRLVQSGQASTAGGTAAYLSAVLGQMTSRPAVATAPAVTLPESLRGGAIDPAAPYFRPFEQWRYARSVGLDDATARERGRVRLERQVDDDMSMAMREAARQALTGHRDDSGRRADQIVGYRRVIRPEQSRTGTCGLCLVASNRRYSVAELMPLHTNCHCDVVPITAGQDPGAAINDEDLQALYDVAGGNTAKALLATRVMVVDHGELGPVLTEANAKRVARRRESGAT